jgi:SRSO17 transposase
LAVGGGKVREMQRFVGEGAWDDGAILGKHAELVAESVGDESGVLIVDGSEFPKKGAHSVGVARQYCGVRGKIDNCQAGVFLAYVSERGATLLDRRLYLPQGWFEADARERRERCGVPDEITFHTKPELAWEMIEAAKRSGTLPFSWVLCDEAFGDTPRFLGCLETAEIDYFADVSVSTGVWLERPRTQVPAPTGRGRPPSRTRLVPGAPRPIRVDELAAQLPNSAWRKHRVKQGEKGPIDARFAFVRAVAVRGKLPGPDVWVVLRRSLSDPPELKVFLSNAPASTPRRELVRLSGMRWPIETCFQQAKGELGMDEYQTRSWRGWHHHMTLVILAHHFLLRLKVQHKKGHRRSRSGKSASCWRPPSPAVS